MPTKEEILNGELARLLTEHGVEAVAEQGRGARRIDVLAVVDGLEIAIEAERGYQKKRQALADADARFNQHLSTLAFAICYPSDASRQSLAAVELQWLLRTREAWAADSSPDEAEWRSGSVAEFAEAVRQAPGSVANADKAAQMLSDCLDAAVQSLGASQRRDLAAELDLPSDGGKKATEYFTAAKRGMLVIAMAMLFHHRLHDHLPEDAPGDWDREVHPDWPPHSPVHCGEDPLSSLSRFDEAWRLILLVDYRPVFESARAALNALGRMPRTGNAVFSLAKCVEHIAVITHGLRHDLLGRIFHRVLDTARYDGSFYTSTAAATLLASLAIGEEDCDWSDVNAIANLRICDPACGTGTLLMAAAERILQLRRSAGPDDVEDEATLALCLVEDVLWGYDINITATHMAASAIGMLSPRTQFGRMRLYRVFLGVNDGQAYMGSLEVLDGQMRMLGWPGATSQIDNGQAANPAPMDLVIMNPPYTRDSLRHDQFTREEERALKAREKQIVDMADISDAVHLSGSSTIFVALGNHLLADKAGTLALVLPSVIPTAPSGLGVRRMLAEEFHIETIVTSHDPERINMSESTEIGEVLVIGRRRPNGDDAPPTRFINLSENPSTPIDASNLFHQIRTGRDGPFTVQEIPYARIRTGDWYAANFYNPNLVAVFQELNAAPATDNGGQSETTFLPGFLDESTYNTDKYEPFSTIPMHEIASVGPAGRRIRDAYRRVPRPQRGSRRALWHHKSEVLQSMRAQPDSHIARKPDKKALADSYWADRSRLLLPSQLWLPAIHVTAVVLDTPAVGSRWIPCRPDDESDETALALASYLNSSIGILALLGARDNKKPSYPSFSLDTLRSIPVPDFAYYGEQARDILAAAFETLRDEALLSLPEMYNDPVRIALDDAVAEAFNLDPHWIIEIRRSLSEEPSITGRRVGI